MKSLIATVAVLSSFAFFCASAMAAFNLSETEIVYCQNGSIEKMGDRHLAIELSSDGIVVIPWETAIPFGNEDIFEAMGMASVLNKEVTLSSEGDEWIARSSAFFVYDQRNLILRALVYVDGQAIGSTKGWMRLTCESIKGN